MHENWVGFGLIIVDANGGLLAEPCETKSPEQTAVCIYKDRGDKSEADA